MWMSRLRLTVRWLMRRERVTKQVLWLLRCGNKDAFSSSTYYVEMISICARLFALSVSFPVQRLLLRSVCVMTWVCDVGLADS